ncbi:MAG: O-antigen ligase family protein [Ghiorsea sp.]
MKVWMIKWLPLVAFLSLMAMPNVMDTHALPMLIVPAILLVWLAIIIWVNGIQIEKNSSILVGMLFLSQVYLWVSNGLSSPSSALLGCIWIFVVFLIWNQASFFKQYIDQYYMSVIIAGLLWMLVGAIVWLGWTDGKSISFGLIRLTQDMQQKPTGPFTNGNVFGLMMLCAWVVSVSHWLRSKTSNKLWFFLALLFLVWVFTSLSRGAWLAWVVSLMFFITWLYRSKMWREGGILFCMVIVALVASSTLIHCNLGNIDVYSRIESIMSGYSPRLVLYSSVFEVWKEHWLFGVGLGNLGGHYLTGQAAAFAYLPSGLSGLGATSNAHNHFLQAISEGGLIGFILWVIMSILFFRSLWINGFDMRTKAWLPLNIALVIWIQGLVNISMVEPIPFFIFFVFFTIGVSLQSGAKEKKSYSFSVHIAYLVILSISVILVFQSFVMTKDWALFERMQNAISGEEKALLVKDLIVYSHTYPRLVQQIAIDVVSRNETTGKLVKLQGHFHKALSMEEWPMLFQGLFYSYTLEKDWAKACSLGKYIIKQHWEGDPNIDIYNGACNAEKIDGFKLRWR